MNESLPHPGLLIGERTFYPGIQSSLQTHFHHALDPTVSILSIVMTDFILYFTLKRKYSPHL